jgi:hypothetical protein
MTNKKYTAACHTFLPLNHITENGQNRSAQNFSQTKLFQNLPMDKFFMPEHISCSGKTFRYDET